MGDDRVLGGELLVCCWWANIIRSVRNTERTERHTNRDVAVGD